MAIPILVGFSLYLSTYLFSAMALGKIFESSLLNPILVHAVPITVTWLAFVSIYLWMPNHCCPVNILAIPSKLLIL